MRSIKKSKNLNFEIRHTKNILCFCTRVHKIAILKRLLRNFCNNHSRRTFSLDKGTHSHMSTTAHMCVEWFLCMGCEIGMISISKHFCGWSSICSEMRFCVFLIVFHHRSLNLGPLRIYYTKF